MTLRADRATRARSDTFPSKGGGNHNHVVCDVGPPTTVVAGGPTSRATAPPTLLPPHPHRGAVRCARPPRGCVCMSAVPSHAAAVVCHGPAGGSHPGGGTCPGRGWVDPPPPGAAVAARGGALALVGRPWPRRARAQVGRACAHGAPACRRACFAAARWRARRRAAATQRAPPLRLSAAAARGIKAPGWARQEPSSDDTTQHRSSHPARPRPVERR